MNATPARRLVLLRHAKSAWPDVPDRERPLAKRGQRDAPAAGRWLREADCVPDRVLCSPARRAIQTWELAQSELGASPPVTVEGRVYNASVPELLDVIRAVPAGIRTLLVVGHDPAVQGVALTLVGGTDGAGRPAGGPDGSAAETIDRMRAKFPTAAIAVLELTGTWRQLRPGQARLARFVVPRDIPG
ncbi:MAG: histidine phosphatase family protein [Actinobacteria bacterium]|nr:histidine phosphatase family protein [Actinomycetota bacterium]